MKKSQLMKDYDAWRKGRLKQIAKYQSEGRVFKDSYINNLRERKRITYKQFEHLKDLYTAKELRVHSQLSVNVNELSGYSSATPYKLNDDSFTISAPNAKKMAGLVNEGLMNVNKKSENGIKTNMPNYLPDFLMTIARVDRLNAGSTYRSTEGAFTIDDDWNGDMSTLQKHVTFLRISPKSEDSIDAFEQLMSIPYLTEQHEELFKKEWHEKSATSFIENRTEDVTGKNKKYFISDAGFIAKVKDVIDQSHMWAIASKGLPYKDKQNVGTHEANYMKLVALYESTAELGDVTLLDEFKSMIDREEDINMIVGQVDEWIKAAYAE